MGNKSEKDRRILIAVLMCYMEHHKTKESFIKAMRKHTSYSEEELSLVYTTYQKEETDSLISPDLWDTWLIIVLLPFEKSKIEPVKKPVIPIGSTHDGTVTLWEFVEMYYPNYSGSDEIALNDDMQKILDGQYEKGDCAYELLMSEYDGRADNPKLREDFWQSTANIFEATINSFLESKEVEDKITYYLFGEDAVREYEENGIDGVVKEYENNELSFSTYAHNESKHSSCVLDQMDGWYNYAIILKEEYEKLN